MSASGVHDAGRRAAAADWRGAADARRREAAAAEAAGDFAAADDHLRAALSLYVVLDDTFSAGRALADLARIRLGLGDFPGAAELAWQAADRIPGDIQALTVLGYAEWQAGSPADAEATFSQALHWDADAAPALAGRGQARADLGSYQTALDDLDRALKLGLDRVAEADARYARALALAELGRAADARGELAASLRLAPDRPRSRQRVDRIAALTAPGKPLGTPREANLGFSPSRGTREALMLRRVKLWKLRHLPYCDLWRQKVTLSREWPHQRPHVREVSTYAQASPKVLALPAGRGHPGRGPDDRPQR